MIIKTKKKKIKIEKVTKSNKISNVKIKIKEAKNLIKMLIMIKRRIYLCLAEELGSLKKTK